MRGFFSAAAFAFSPLGRGPQAMNERV